MMKHSWVTLSWICLLGAPCVCSADTAAMSVAILNRSNGAVAPSITWSNANVGGPWQIADQYLQITSVLTTAGSGIQTYTQNSGGLYTGPASSTTAAGLVNTSAPTQTIPMGWQINASTTPTAADDPNCYGIGQPAYCGPTAGRTGWAWFYYQDKGGGLLPNADPSSQYIQVEESGGSGISPPYIHWNSGELFGQSVSAVNNFFLEANFQYAVGVTYQTNTLTLELFTP